MKRKMVWKFLKWSAVTAAAAAVILACLLGMNIYYTMNRVFPWEKQNIWVCDDPYIRFERIDYQKGEYREWYTKTTVMIDGELNDSALTLNFTYSDLVHIQVAESMGQKMLVGPWRYKGDNFIVKVERDDIFGGAYSQLVFHPAE